ncbi:hypothetical protein BDFG_09160, partial [Blastomyces dermatitidis ATCC 26199]
LATSVLQLCDLFLIQLVFCVHSHKETFTILHHSFTNFSHSSIIFFISSSSNVTIIQDFYLFFCSTLSICSSITSYTFLAMISHFHNKHHCSAHTEQFISKSLYIDRFISADDSELSVESLIENLKNIIIKKLSVSYVIRSSASLSILSVSFSAALSQSSTSVSVSDFSLTISVSVTSTLTTLSFTVSVFITSSLCFKKMLYRLSESHFSVYTLSLFLSISRMIYCMKTAKDIHIFRNRNMNVVLFYTHRYEAYIP